jgi:hypothetical protein
MTGDRFVENGSPLSGRLVPRDWKLMNPTAKRACLIANGWATDFYDAGRVLAKHAAAAVQGRKAKEARAALAMARWEN